MSELSQTIVTPLPSNPIAVIKGKALLDVPKDLYIPPEAMQVLLEAFEGPLDLLLYLIKKQNLDILDIPVAAIAKQYLEYIELMSEFHLELAAEYLVMAAILAEIKSRMLLPRVDEETSEEDPRAELVHRLQEYETYKRAAQNLDQLPRIERDLFPVVIDMSAIQITKPQPKLIFPELIQAFSEVLNRAALHLNHQIQMDAISVREKMTFILATLNDDDHMGFESLFNLQEGRMGVVVTFLAFLELLKENLIEFIQAAPFTTIYLKRKAK